MSSRMSLPLICDEWTGSCLIDISSKTPWCLIVSSERLGRILCSAVDLFTALCRIRIVLESQNCKICCNGARIDSWASNLGRDMGGGRKVYITTMGKLASLSDLVPTFGDCQSSKIGTTVEQIFYHRQWLESLMRESGHHTSIAAHREASLYTDGWVYKIDGKYGPDEDTPFNAIIGWWKVDANGKIVGDFISNPEYISTKKRSEKGTS